MGVWGLGPFNGDGALDGLDHIDAGPPEGVAARVHEVLDLATEREGRLDGTDAESAMAAVALIGARLGVPIEDETARETYERSPFTVTRELVEHALRAWDRVTAATGSEWHDVWADVESLPQVLALHEPYRAALAAARERMRD